MHESAQLKLTVAVSGSEESLERGGTVLMVAATIERKMIERKMIERKMIERDRNRMIQ
jgi:hypothetical protein